MKHLTITVPNSIAPKMERGVRQNGHTPNNIGICSSPWLGGPIFDLCQNNRKIGIYPWIAEIILQTWLPSSCSCSATKQPMMTSSNGNIFRVTGHLCGEFPTQRPVTGALMFSLICVWIIGWVNNREAGDLRRYRAHYDVSVMQCHEGEWRSPVWC